MTMPTSMSNQQASSASGTSNSGFDNSGFVVNYGGAVATGQAIPPWVWMAALGLGALWLLMRKR